MIYNKHTCMYESYILNLISLLAGQEVMYVLKLNYTAVTSIYGSGSSKGVIT